jgi:hypothetical protein
MSAGTVTARRLVLQWRVMPALLISLATGLRLGDARAAGRGKRGPAA